MQILQIYFHDNWKLTNNFFIKNEVLTYSTSSKSHKMNTFWNFNVMKHYFQFLINTLLFSLKKTQGHQKRFSDINLSTLLLSMINYVDSWAVNCHIFTFKNKIKIIKFDRTPWSISDYEITTLWHIYTYLLIFLQKPLWTKTIFHSKYHNFVYTLIS